MQLMELRAETRARSEREEVEFGPVLALRWRGAIAAYVALQLRENWTPGWSAISELTTSQLAEIVDGARSEPEAFAMVGYSAATVDAQREMRRRAAHGRL